MNKFEQYLKHNKDKFECIEVNPRIWDSVENALLKKKKPTIRIYLPVAASILFLLSVIGFLKYSVFMPEQNYQLSLSDYSPEYGQLELGFQYAISIQKARVQNFEIPADLASDFKILTRELDELDKQYRLYIELIQEQGYNASIGNKIIEYYSIKLDMLKKIQHDIIKVNDFKKDQSDEYNKIKIKL